MWDLSCLGVTDTEAVPVTVLRVNSLSATEMDRICLIRHLVSLKRILTVFTSFGRHGRVFWGRHGGAVRCVRAILHSCAFHAYCSWITHSYSFSNAYPWLACSVCCFTARALSNFPLITTLYLSPLLLLVSNYFILKLVIVFWVLRFGCVFWFLEEAIRYTKSKGGEIICEIGKWRGRTRGASGDGNRGVDVGALEILALCNSEKGA